MPIEFCFVPFDSDVEEGHQLLEFREAGVIMRDYSQGNLKYVGIECNMLDDGGKIEIFPDDGILSEIIAATQAGNLPEPIATILVPEGGMQEIDVAAPDDEQAILRVRHVAANKITRSFSIPLGLQFPDMGAVTGSSEQYT
jgi:hypothetical protein